MVPLDNRSLQVQRALELVGPFCDLQARLERVPPSARVRGLSLQAIERALLSRGRLGPYRDFFRDRSWSPIQMAPLSDYLVRLAVAGAILRSPERLAEGMRDIGRVSATCLGSSALGRSFLRLPSRDPVRLLEQTLAARRQTFQYGQWEMVHNRRRSLELIYREEYVWIESAVAGGVVGALESGKLEVNSETRQVGWFEGSTRVTW